MIIDGKTIAAHFRQGLSDEVKTMAENNFRPGLAVIMVGDHPASDIYVRNKIAACHKTGIESFQYRLPAETHQADIESLVMRLNTDSSVHGILLQLPVPPHIDSMALIRLIDPVKDVDGLHPINLGNLILGMPAMVPCTPRGAILLIKSVEKNIAGLHAVIIGRSILFGKPMGQLLLSEDCTVTQAHSKTKDLPALCAQADILVAAAGQPEMVKGDWIKPGAIIIDVGITRNANGTLQGDVDFHAAKNIARAITPVPGGVGPMTIACLLENTIKAAKAQQGHVRPANPMP